MRIDIGADVVTKSGQHVGKVDRVVLDPRALKVTHIIIHKGFLLTRDIVVPVEDIDSAREGKVNLKVTSTEVEKMPDFVEAEYVAPPQAAPIGPYIPGTALWPSAYAYAPSVLREERHVPEESIDITEGTDVRCVDGKLGIVDEVLYDPSTGRITGLIVRRGVFLPRDVTIPVSWVKQASSDVVELACTKKEAEKLARQQGGRGQGKL